MKRKGAPGRPARRRLRPTTHGEFTTRVNTLVRLESPRSGWDPYQAWRTRVKTSSRVKRERDPLR
jgi:hypothetical protein